MGALETPCNQSHRQFDFIHFLQVLQGLLRQHRVRPVPETESRTKVQAGH